MNKVFVFLCIVISAWFVSCAGQRQGLVCDEIEYRLNTQTYSPDQRAYIEEELRVCREEEAQKRGADAQSRQSIYDRYASDKGNGSTKQDKSIEKENDVREVSVSEALKDSSGQETVSIYDRYGSKNESSENAGESAASSGCSDGNCADEAVADTSAAKASAFQ